MKRLLSLLLSALLAVSAAARTLNVNGFCTTTRHTDQSASKTANGVGSGNVSQTTRTANQTASTAKKNTVFPNGTLIVSSVVSNIVTKNVTTTYGNPAKLVATVTDQSGKAMEGKFVTFSINGETYTKATNAEGFASLRIKTLKPGTYKAIVSCEGITAKAEVVVKKQPTKLTAKKKTYKENKKIKKYSVVLKTKNGKAIKKAKVTLKIKGKTYKAKTNSKGKATFKIKKKLKKGTYKATVKFAGTKIYKATSKKVKIKVKK